MTDRAATLDAPGVDAWADAQARVGAALDRIESEHQVRIIFAVESGSRAWGFPSPDSDYDCRSVFARRRERYLSLWPPRDVIELPLEGDLDVNGWDAGKAIRLLCKGNAVILEWLASPLAYRAEPGSRERFAALARRLVDRGSVARHYLHLGEEMMRRHLQEGDAVKLKKLFYALRPAAAIRWMRLREDGALPPMSFPTLMSECEPPAAVASYAAELVARKAVTRELGAAELPPFVRAFMLSEFEAARSTFGRAHRAMSADDEAFADAFFRETLDRYG